LIAHLEHPHVVQVLDFGVEENTPFLVMAYAPNGTLRHHHPRGIPLPLEQVVLYVKQMAEALQFAHNQRLIHRDIKPENMLVGRNHEILLSDFGIALVTPSTRAQSLLEQNSTTGMAGTLPYMAPEQIQGKPVPASDQYALAVVAYEWLCGVLPFTGGYMEIAMQHVSALPPLLREKVPTLPPDVEKVVLTALAKEPRQRFANIQAFATALEQASHSASSPMLMARPAHVPSSAPWEQLPLSTGGSITPKKAAPLSNTPTPGAASGSWESAVFAVSPPPPMYTGYGGGVPQGEQQGGISLFSLPTEQSLRTPPRSVLAHGASAEALTPMPEHLLPNSVVSVGSSSSVAVPSVSPPRATHRVRWVVLSIVLTLLLLAGGAFGGLAYVQSLPTPTKTLDAFCTALLDKDYQAAYHHLSSTFQNRVSETLFAEFFASSTACRHGTVGQAGNTATASLTTSSPARTNTDSVTLTQNGDGSWKIDNDANLAGLTKTLDTYCHALQQADYPTAYNQFSGKLQSQLTEGQLASFVPKASSCTYGSLSLSAKSTQATVTTISTSGQTENDVISLIQDGNNSWKIDDITNLPDKTLDTFCAALQNKDYQTAYNQTSVGYQGSVSESRFADNYSVVTSCAHGASTKPNGDVIANITFGLGSAGQVQERAFLIKDSSGTWKIDNIVYLPDVPLNTFCTALQNQDYQTAYDQLSDAYQAAYPESQFAKDVSGFTGCKYDVAIESGNTATSIMTFSTTSGQTVKYKVTLIQDKNGDWRIDSFQHI